MSRFINYNNLEISNIIYKDPIDKLAIILNNNKLNVEPLLIYTPVMRVKTIINIDNGFSIIKGNKLILDLTSNIKFYDFVRRIDELNISNCYYNSQKWFKKDISLEIVENFYM